VTKVIREKKSGEAKRRQHGGLGQGNCNGGFEEGHWMNRVEGRKGRPMSKWGAGQSFDRICWASVGRRRNLISVNKSRLPVHVLVTALSATANRLPSRFPKNGTHTPFRCIPSGKIVNKFGKITPSMFLTIHWDNSGESSTTLLHRV
jgi:hypothetical protein